MRKLKLLSFLFFALGLNAQQQNTSNLQEAVTPVAEKCRAAQLHEHLMQTDPQYVQKRNEIEAHYQNVLNSGVLDKTTYTIPVVVHVIHTGQAVGVGANISDAQIQSAIDNLNDAYSNNSTAFTTYTGVNTNIQFCLAQRDPNGNPTTGIVRVDGSGVTQYSSKGVCDAGGGTGTDNEQAVKALSKWDNTKYYNFWIVTEINDNGGGAGTQGYAYFPGAGAAVDGAIMLYNAFGYDPDGSLGYNLKSYTNRNVTPVHEVGHALNLYHTFQGDGTGSTCPTDAVCGTSGDCVADTPRHKRSASSCVADGTANTCQAGTTAGDYQHNFMDYSSDVCQTEFTAGQVTRMNAVMTGSRASLNLSDGCNPVYVNEASLYAVLTPASGSECGSTVDPEVTIKNTGSATLTSLTITYTMDGGAPTVYNWTGSLTQGSTADVVIGTGVASAAGAHTFVCTISLPNGVADPYSANDSKTVNYTSTGSTPAAASCTPTTTNLGNFGTGIDRVQFNTIDNANTANNNDGLSDFSCTYYTTVSTNTGYNLTVTTQDAEYVIAYLDYDDDGLFEAGELVLDHHNTSNATSHSVTVNIPQYPAVTGKLIRMRIKSNFNAMSTNICTDSDYGEFEDYGVFITTPPCVAPVLNSSPVDLSGCSPASGTFTCSATGPSLTYQWQVNTGASFVNVSNGGVYSGATSSTLTVTGADNTYNGYVYRCYISNACGNVTTNIASLYSYASPTASCLPSTVNTGNFGTGIVRFQFNTIDNAHNDGVNDGTQNFTCAAVTSVIAGSTYAFTITGGGGNPENGRIFIDYNDNGTFDSGEMVFDNTVNATSHSGNIVIASSGFVAGKILRMRVITDFSTLPASGGCANVNYGEIEDYGVVIAAVPTITAAVGGARCDNGTLNLSATPSAGSVRWYDASSGGNLVGVGTSFVTPALSSTTVYYAEAVNGPAISAARTAVTAAIGYCTSKVVDAQCGTTLGGVHQAIYAEAIQGATEYKFEVKNGSNIQTFTTANRFFYLYNVNFLYNTTYSIRVAVKVGGSYLPFGNGCSITTPDGPAIAASQCGISISASGTPIYSTFIPNATHYKFKVVKGANIQYFESVNRWFKFDDLTSFTYNTNYTVSVAAKVGGLYGPYGTACTVTSPTTRIVNEQCNSTINSKTTNILAYSVPGATAYRFKIAGPAGTQIIERAVRYFSLQEINYTLNTTYTVTVSVIQGGVLSPYGQACTITTPSSNIIMQNDDIDMASGLERLELGTYPNPNDGNFTVSSSFEGTFNVLNELGQVVQVVVISKEGNYKAKVEGLKQGVYFVTGAVNNEVITQKVVVQ